MNYIDIIIIIILILYLFDGFRRGFISVSLEIAEFLLSVIVALKFYPNVAKYISTFFSIPTFWQNIIGFLLVWIIAEIIFSLIARLVKSVIPGFLKRSFPNRILGIFVSFIKGLLIIAILLTLFFASPFLPHVKNAISSSLIGNTIVLKSAKTFVNFQKQLGGEIEQNSLYLTSKPSGETTKLNFKPKDYVVDSQAEQKMFDLVNLERKKAGLKPLVSSEELQKVARAHAWDMWQREYFAHISPDGIEPLLRVLNAGIKFQVVGENLALAPNANLAHIGLMNSPSHRDNILDNNFRQIGIGVIDGGIYGKMFVQNFTD